jgi:transposase InsO family protein
MGLVKEAQSSGARRKLSCELLGVSLRTVERWESNPSKEDGRQGPLNPGQRFSPEEKKLILDVANSFEYRDLSPWQIVPRLADQGRYLASESSFYRILKANEQLNHRQKSSPPRRITKPEELMATKPNQIWSWDITYLATAIRGMFYYLYLPMDIFSRFIVHWEIHERQTEELAAQMITTACLKQGVSKNQITLHADNGGPMKGATMLATLQRLGIMPSFSRPSVSDDNPFSESLFKTLKYCPAYPEKPFATIVEAKAWVEKFVQWYNNVHLHSQIRFVTPASRHYGLDQNILEKRKVIYQKAQEMNPGRWSGEIRNWNRIDSVYLNPQKETQNKEVFSMGA